MVTVPITMVSTQWELYPSQWLPKNKNLTLHNGFYRMGTVHFKMVTHNGNSTVYNGYHTIVTVHFTMVMHNENSTLLNGYHTMGTVHFTMVTTQW